MKKKFQKTLILAFEVIVQPPKRHFLTFWKVQKTHYGEKMWGQNHEKQLVPDRLLPRLIVLLFPYREDFERELGINITMVGIDECLYENENCEGSCTNR